MQIIQKGVKVLGSVYFPFLNLPGVAPVFSFFFADPLISGS